MTTKRMEYVGYIKELQGRTALVREVQDHDLNQILIPLDLKNTVMAQFDEPVVLFGRRLHVGWHPFTETQFMEIGNKPVF